MGLGEAYRRVGPEERAARSERRPRALIVDDHKLFAHLIRPPLEEQGIRVVGLAEHGRAALAEVRDKRPDLVLLDLGLADEDGISVGRRILNEFPQTRLIAVTPYADSDAVKEAAAAGFHASVTKDTPLSHFVAAIRSVLEGHNWADCVPSSLDPPEATRGNGASGSPIPTDVLTQREYEVLMLLTEGSSSREMAERLVLSPNTVRTHVQSVLTKLQVHSRIEAAAIAVRNGLANGQRRASS